MLSYKRRYWLIAASLALVAGFVDALAFLDIGGFFVSFMSGNSTRAGVGLAADPSHAEIAISLIGAFVAGVILGSLLSRPMKHGVSVLALALVAGLLTASGIWALLNQRFLAVIFMAAAMGASNTTFQRSGEVSVGVTYMTGALVKLGQHVAEAIRGGSRFSWAPYLMLWIGLVVGAATGALIYPILHLDAIWIAAICSAIIGLTLAVMERDAG